MYILFNTGTFRDWNKENLETYWLSLTVFVEAPIARGFKQVVKLSQNLRMAWLEGITVNHLVQPLCSSRTIWKHMVPDYIQTILLSIFSDGDSTDFSGQPVLVCAHLHSEEVLPHGQVEFPIPPQSLLSYCLVPSRAWSILLSSHLEMLTDIDDVPSQWPLVKAGGTQLCSLSS